MRLIFFRPVSNWEKALSIWLQSLIGTAKKDFTRPLATKIQMKFTIKL